MTGGAPGQAEGHEQDDGQANDDVRETPVVVQRLQQAS